MFRAKIEKVAADLAKEHGLSYGWSVFGDWFVGTEEQLAKIGVTEVKTPEN